MKWFMEAGTICYDYVMTTLFLIVAGFLIVPFYAIYVGVVGFYDRDRSYGALWKTIRENVKPIAILTVVLLLIMVSAYGLNLIGLDRFFVQASLGILAILVWLMFTYVPIIIIRMRTTWSELIYNALSMMFNNWKTTIFLIMLFIALTYVFIYELILILFLIEMLVRSVHYVTAKSFDHMREKTEENEK
jgi:uncharacterized membrane protein YesL